MTKLAAYETKILTTVFYWLGTFHSRVTQPFVKPKYSFYNDQSHLTVNELNSSIAFNDSFMAEKLTTSRGSWFDPIRKNILDPLSR